MSDPTTPAVKGTQPPMSDPQPQRPVSEAPHRNNQWLARLSDSELIANADEVIEAASAKLSALCRGERWRMCVPVQDSDSDVPLGRVIALARLLSRRAVSEAPAAPERVRTAPPQEDARRYEWGTLVGPFAIIQTIGGDFLLVDETDESRPLARFVNEDSAEVVGRWMARTEAKSILSRPSAPSGAPTTPRIVTEPGDWPEDFAYENGQYYSTCRACQQPFKGHKRRVRCKTCASAPTTEEKP